MAFGVHDHPFYKPLWRRVALVATTVLWFAFELFMAKDGLWQVLSGAVCAYSAWVFLITWKDQPPAPPPSAPDA
jgi:hypothetical protein